MDMNEVKEIARKTMSKRKSHLNRERGFIYYHGQRVANLAMNLRKNLFPHESTMDDIIYAGALFHDVTKGIEPHHLTGAELVHTLLNSACSAEELAGISEIIRHHNTRKQADSPDLPYYMKLVQDADILDHFGSMEIWLKFVYSGNNEENVFDAIQLWDSENYAKYVASSREVLNYELSKDIFDQKLIFVEQFQARFRAECNGEISLQHR